MGLQFAPRHLLVPPVEWLRPSFTVISKISYFPFLFQRKNIKQISYFPFLFQRKNIKLKDACIKMFSVALLKMENLIIKYPRKECLNTSRPPLRRQRQCREHIGNPRLGGRGEVGSICGCVYVSNSDIFHFRKKKDSHELSLVLVFSPHPLYFCFLFGGRRGRGAVPTTLRAGPRYRFPGKGFPL